MTEFSILFMACVLALIFLSKPETLEERARRK